AAGLVGLVKVLTAFRHQQIPASICFRNPSTHFDWSDSKLSVVSENQAWPRRELAPRRAAVNAFGIGGLNAHAVISDGKTASTGVPPKKGVGDVSARAKVVRKSPLEEEPIAIVGRGVVLPGAFNVDELAELLVSHRSAVGGNPDDRRRHFGSILKPDDVKQPFRTPHYQGGYIRNYQFDGQPYRIPPKQVAQANPVQMMLIDAVRQAFNEVGEPDGFTVPAGASVLDRRRTSVVIGTIFGGEFSNELQVGMRLPELCRHLKDVMCDLGMEDAQVEDAVNQYRRHMLAQYPALLDETGSFTASTLASRIAKTFDLMGGACAVDADDASGMLALLTAVDQLRSGEVDTVVCGVAQRSLDLVAFEQLNLRDQLVTSGDPDDVPADCARVIPGEGVAVVLLQRSQDAQKQNRKSYGEFSRLKTGFRDDPVQGRRDAMGRDLGNARLIRKIGYLSGAHGLVRAIAHTTDRKSFHGVPPLLAIEAVAEDGFVVEAKLRVDLPGHAGEQGSRYSSMPGCAPVDMDSKQSVISTESGHRSKEQNDWLTLTCRADDVAQLAIQLNGWKTSPEAAWESALSRSNFSTSTMPSVGERGLHAVLVCSGPGTIAGQADRLLAACSSGVTSGVVEQAGGFLWAATRERNRVGFLFPGQGSQYAAVPKILDRDPDARNDFADFDATLMEAGLAPIGQELADPNRRLGSDIWWTQAWILGVSHVLSESLGRSGVRCDVASGHSFGECGAALHAGVMSLRQAVDFARKRSDAVLATVRQPGQLLSIRGSASQVSALLQAAKCEATITHQNAPEQTVVAGSVHDIGVAKRVLSDAGVACVVIPVPAAFHTAAMETAEGILRRSFCNQSMRPPGCVLLSATSLEYMAEPERIRENLISQLTQPVLFSGAVDRLVADGCGLLVEIGPSDVLTRMSRASTNGRSLALALDGGESHDAQLQLIKTAHALVTRRHVRPAVLEIANRDLDVVVHGAGALANGNASEISDVEVLDVTSSRKTKGDRLPHASEQESEVAEDQAAFAAPFARENSVRATTAGVVNDGFKDAVAASAGGTKQREKVRHFLVDLVVELTGYSADVVDFDADLEAELGIDSIKKAQVIGELAEWGDIQLDLTSMKLSDYVSLSDIAALHSDCDLGSVVSGNGRLYPSDTLPVSPSIAASPSLNGRGPGDEPTREVDSDPVGMRHDPNGNRTVAESMASLMVDFVVDQTGYSADVVDLHADLESELGLDSIKKAQLLGELQEQFGLSALDLGQVKLSDFATLETIQTFVLRQIGEEADAPSMPVESTERLSAEGLKIHCDDEEKKNGESFRESSGQAEALIRREPALHGTSPRRSIPADGTCRFRLKTVRADRVPGDPADPIFNGPAILLGDNEVSETLRASLQRKGVDCLVLRDAATVDDVDRFLDQVWERTETPHLFLASPRDCDALAGLDSQAWERRRDKALTVPFRLCQRWMQRLIDKDLMNQGSLVSILNGGGRFGFEGGNIPSAESGGIAGLTKAMLIESWMRGYRDTPMLIVDGAEEASPESIVEGVFRELAVPSYDEEVVVDGEHRWTIDAEYAPLPDLETEEAASSSRITPGGTWIVSGGGRGITAMTTLELARRHGLSLHLLGTAPPPHLDEATRRVALEDRSGLRRTVMRRAQAAGKNPIESWRDLEKAIEIDQTLQDAARRGIRVAYHSVDVSCAASLERLIDEIRRTDGPIRGVVHGAGAGQDARFDRKRPEKVSKCIRAKVDGCIHLAKLTESDPLEWFVGFGSISGRFGANGHTDYSLANDMLSKCLVR
ncbi:MAG: beta-ketoacyl synthase N-terminal-like domain-containing protein, partial [Planctomycetota bacterium]